MIRWLAAALLLVQALPLAAQTGRDLRFELMVEEPAKPSESRTWAIIVGISNYRNLPDSAQLQYAHRDAESFRDYLMSPEGGSLPASRIHLLTNERASIAAVRTALRYWLPKAAGANDTVYLFFAGHGAMETEKDGYLLAHDSDPQNLYATALGFGELDQLLEQNVAARRLILVVDACHAGSIGWRMSTARVNLGNVNNSLESLGRSRASLLRLLASRGDERSYEDQRWGGGHGVFTWFLLKGLEGKAERDGDKTVRAGELADFVATAVERETAGQQHPRVAGNLDAGLVLADLRGITAPRQAPPPATPGREPLIEAFDQAMAANRVIEPGGAWEIYQVVARQNPNNPHRVRLELQLGRALEAIGQEGVSDYVDSTSAGLKLTLMQRAAAAYARLVQLRPNDKTVLGKALFAQGRTLLLEGRVPEAKEALLKSIEADPQSACATNALAVAYERSGDFQQAVALYRQAARLAPQWALPRMHLSTRFQAEQQLQDALLHAEEAVQLQPGNVLARWAVVRLNRLLNRLPEAHKAAVELARLSPNYAPVYAELGQIFEANGQLDAAADAYNAYVQLAPNFVDSNAVRERVKALRSKENKKAPPSLRKK